MVNILVEEVDMKPNVFDLIKHDRCCGCLACKESCPVGAINKEQDKYGFLYPTIDKPKCLHCGKCVAACPALEEHIFNYPIKTYAAINKTGEVVYNSSSGGIFTPLAEYIIECGGIVCGATMDDQFNVYHIFVEDTSSLHLLQKSKYVQSNIEGVFSQIKDELEIKKVLFSGTPCQVAALRTFLGKDYDNLLTVDVVCHGVPNNELFKDYISFLKSADNSISSYEFRAKKQVQNGMNWYSAIHYSDGSRKVFNWPTDSYNYYYMNCKTYRESCYDCQFARIERPSDLTLCDYWGWEKHHKGAFPRNSSVSGIILNSEKGLNLFNLIASKLSYVESDYQSIVAHNQSLMKTAAKPNDREDLLNLWRKMGYENLDKKFRTDNRKHILKYKLIDMIPEKIKSEVMR